MLKIKQKETEKLKIKQKETERLKIKQKVKDKLCDKCNRYFTATFINRHKDLHKGKFYFFQSNLSSIQINQIMKKKSCFQYFDFDKLSNLDQIQKNRQIKHFSQVANQNNKILCFLSRFETQLSLDTTRLKFWSFPKNQLIFQMKPIRQIFFLDMSVI